MKTIIICRTILPDGSLKEDSGIELNIDGPTAKLLQEVRTPLFSNPITGEIAGVLTFPQETNGQFMKGLLVSPKGALGPPEHYHPNYTEDFSIVEGGFIFQHNKEKILVKAGEKLSVQPNISHTFRPSDHPVNTFVVLVKPPGLLTELVKTLFGLAHDGKLNNKGEPGFMQAMALARSLSEDTIFTKPPLVVQKVMASLFAPIASLLGYKAIYPEYINDSFWQKRVEQLVKEPVF